MNRRAFFTAAAGVAAFALDPERALWVPGKKMISIPKTTTLCAVYRPFVILLKEMTRAEFRAMWPDDPALLVDAPSSRFFGPASKFPPPPRV